MPARAGRQASCVGIDRGTWVCATRHHSIWCRFQVLGKLHLDHWGQAWGSLAAAACSGARGACGSGATPWGVWLAGRFKEELQDGADRKARLIGEHTKATANGQAAACSLGQDHRGRSAHTARGAEAPVGGSCQGPVAVPETSSCSNGPKLKVFTVLSALFYGTGVGGNGLVHTKPPTPTALSARSPPSCTRCSPSSS